MTSPVFTFDKTQRLLKPKQFKFVYRSQYWGNSQHYSFNVRPTSTGEDDTSSTVRVGITVAKKVSKRAVDRNRYKREIREFIRHRLTQLHSVDVVITAKPICAKATDAERLEGLEQLWSKLLGWL